MTREKNKNSKEKSTKSKQQEAPLLPAPTPAAGGKGPEQNFPVVALGASAGGLEAFEQFFTHLPPDSGMAFVLIQHLDPHHKSILSEILRRYTRMQVVEVADGMMLKTDMVFVIPPNRYLAVHHGKLHLLEPTNVHGPRTPIDYFFRSLASDQKEKAVCIVLSGTGSEGALGLRAIKGEGGMAMVQDPKTAKYDGMPRNALVTGLADYTLPPDKMPEHLSTMSNMPWRRRVTSVFPLPCPPRPICWKKSSSSSAPKPGTTLPITSKTPFYAVLKEGWR